MNKSHFIIDIDSPDFPLKTDAIKMHSRIADVYKFRPPYKDIFFQQLADKLKLKSTSDILDLCCGRGELASGMINFARNIYGVDGSSEMLSNSIKKPNITYYQADINNNLLPFKDKFDYFTIGTAIHWIRSVALNSIIHNHLRKNGKIIVTHTFFRFDAEKFDKPLRKLNQKFGHTRRKFDFSGIEKLEALGFFQSDTLGIKCDVTINVDFLYANQLSYAYFNFYKGIAQQPDAYRHEFYKTIAPYSVNGKLQAKLFNWAGIYKSN